MAEGTADLGLVRRTLALVRERWPVIAGVVVLVAAASVVRASLQEPRYRSSIEVLFRDTTLAQQVTGVDSFQAPQDTSGGGSEMTTNIQLLQSRDVADGVVARLGLDVTGADLEHDVTVTQQGLANIGLVSASAGSAVEAQRIAQAWGEVFIAQRRTADRAKLAQATRLLRRSIERAQDQGDTDDFVLRTSRNQLQRLRLLEAVQDGGAEIVRPADRPPAAYAPRPLRSGLVGALVGLLFGVALAAALRTVDRRVRSVAAARTAADVPILGELDKSAFQVAPRSLLGAHGSEAWGTIESFRTLATNIRLMGVGGPKVVAIVSAEPAAGKTTVAAGLSVALAEMRRVVCLLDLDMRRGRIGAAFDLPPGPGASSVLAGLASGEEAFQIPPLASADPREPLPLSVVPAGPAPPNPVELLSGEQLRALVGKAADRSDYVLVDTPPVLRVSDALAIASVVDGVVLVVRVGKTTHEQVRLLHERLSQAGARIYGLVATSAGVGAGSNAYYGRAPETGAAKERDGEAVTGSATGRS